MPDSLRGVPRLATLLACAVLLCPSTTTLASAVPAPLPLPNLDLRGGGDVLAIARAADGSLYVGGGFTSVFDPATQLSFSRGGLARILPNGSLDLAWDPSPPGSFVYDLELDGGFLYVAGGFSAMGGAQRSSVARISPTGTGAADPAWAPQPNSVVYAIAVDGAAGVYLGGSFTTVDAILRGGIARVAATGTGALDQTWDASTDGYVRALALDGGFLYAGGVFDTVAGAPRRALARVAVSGNGAPDPAWAPVVDCREDFGLFYSCVNTIATGAAATVYVGGWFAAVDGSPASNLVRLSAGGAVDATWKPDPNSTVAAIAVDAAAAAVYVSGYFTFLGGANRLRVAKLALAGAGDADPAWDAEVDQYVGALALGSGETIIGGLFTRARGAVRFGLARLPAAGAPLPSPPIQSNGIVRGIEVAADGSAYVYGEFLRADGRERNGLLRLAPDGSLDTAWDPQPQCIIASSCILDLAVVGNVPYVSGFFSAIGGQPIGLLARLDASGAADPAWNPAPNGIVRAIQPASDGSLYIGGYFSSLGPDARSGIARFTPTGSIDGAWAPNVDCSEGAGCVEFIALGPAGQVYLGGRFSSVGGQPRPGLALVAAAAPGNVDVGWNPAPNGAIGPSLAVDASGAVYVSGGFTQIGGAARNGFAKLLGNGAGGVDPGWTPPNDFPFTLVVVGGDRVLAGSFNGVRRYEPTGGDPDQAWQPSTIGSVEAIAVRPDGNVLFGGRITAVASVGRLGIAAVPPVVDPLFANGFE